MLTQKQIDKLCELVEYLTDNGFTDMSDASAEISFLEYGMLRNPRANQVIYCGPVDCLYAEIRLDWSLIGIDDVKEYLENATDGFYSFIGSTKRKELDQLDNEFLSSLIQTINQYDGNFQQSCVWNHTVDSIKRLISIE